MTADRRAALVEEMCRAVANAWDTEQRMQDGMSAALDIALEEAAKVAESQIPVDIAEDLTSYGERVPEIEIAAAIRALKGKP